MFFRSLGRVLKDISYVWSERHLQLDLEYNHLKPIILLEM